MPGVVIERFPGLDLRADPGDAPSAIDLLNVSVEAGRIRTRDGTVSHLSFTPLGTRPVFLMPFPAAVANPGVMGLIVGSLTNVYAVDQNGASIATTTIAAGSIAGMSGIALGTPAANYAFIASDGSARRWDGTTWTNPVTGTFPASPGIFSISPTDNRLVVGENNASKVWFSEPGDPTTFTASALLDPGDGEIIMGAAVYNNQTFIFKNTKFFVFYGNSDDGIGGTLLNRRAVRTGVKIPGLKSPQSICAGADGVYYIATDGIYRTTGGTPTKISQALDPFFIADSAHVSPFWNGGVWTPLTGGNRLCWSEGNLYASLETSSTTSVVFVLDTDLGSWSAWSFGQTPAICATTQSTSVPTDTQSVFFADGTSNRVLRTKPSATDDAGTAIVSRYRASFETFGEPGEKTVRETIIEGIGAPTVAWSRDWGAPVTGSAVQLGTSPAIAVGRQRLAIRGRALSMQFSAASGRWSVNRYQANILSPPRPPQITV